MNLAGDVHIYTALSWPGANNRVNMFIHMKPTAEGFKYCFFSFFLFCNVNDNNCKDFLTTYNLVGRNFGFDQNQDKETRKKSTVHKETRFLSLSCL